MYYKNWFQPVITIIQQKKKYEVVINRLKIDHTHSTFLSRALNE